jgi:methylated-DNA-[protein]-cysteine S-methyltransferase
MNRATNVRGIGLNPLEEGAVQARADALALRFAEHRADAEVAYALHDSPVGWLLLARTKRGLVRVAFIDVMDTETVLTELAAKVSPRILEIAGRLDDERRELDEYFAGRRVTFEVEVDLALTHAFRREVLDRLRDIPFGTTVSYAALAERAGRPKAVRAAASACATNPVPIVVPCHRVVRSDGALGGYLGGVDAKRALLELEAEARE